MEICIKTPFGASEIVIQKGLFASLAEDIRSLSQGKIFLVSDTHVDPLYGEALFAALKETGEVEKFVFPAGEDAKSFDTYGRLLEALASCQMARSDVVVALGGGVTGDLAGFAAATFKRGVRFLMVPTSLLSQVDAAVGGKTAINLSAGKNLAGAFYAAEKVFIDPELLKTLPERELSSGMAEVIKCAAIKDAALFEELVAGDGMKDLERLIGSAIRIKADLVARDPFDRGERMLLNFGHTFGHAVEKASGSLLHGEAVGIGMLEVTRRSEALGMTEKGTFKKLERALKNARLPLHCACDRQEIRAYLAQDKKYFNGKQNLIVIRRPGAGEIVPVKKDFWEEKGCVQDY